ncbi:MAG TPA: UDP-glucose 4-epimerase GalE [Dehalococcoidia bacterium]|nr:UDP-glucose 4-epimerase GalE [Dehalococcoidia bacterium]
MRILVTGGAGYVGSVTADELIKAGHEVVVLDNLSQGHRAAVPKDARFVEGDLREADFVASVFREHGPFDGVMHFASHTLVPESMRLPFLYLRDNALTATNLMEQAAANGVSRFILSSTANLFAEPETIPIGPDERVVPGSPYGESKHYLERCLHWCETIYGMHYASLRYFNACGGTPERGEDHDPETHLIAVVLQAALGQRKLSIFGKDYPTPDGTCVRDYVHVVDLAQAHILALNALDKLGSRRYNLGNGRGFSNLEVVEAARRVTDLPIPYDFGPRRAGDPAELIASSEQIKQELGWAPRFTEMDDIVASAWEWKNRHPQGYE